MKKIYFLVLSSFLCPAFAHAQNTSPTDLTVITADSLASGNYKDVFTSFFKLAADDLTGPNKSVSFVTNPYAIMAKGNPSLTVDTNYRKYTVLRNINFNMGLNLDSSYHFNGFSLGVKAAVINKRDVTVSDEFVKRASMPSEFSKLREAFDSLLSIDTTITDSENLAFENWMNKKAVSFTSLDAHVQKIINSLVSRYNLNGIATSLKNHPELSFRDLALKAYNDLKDQWQRKPLWTIFGNSNFSPVSGSSTASLSGAVLGTEFLWAFNSPDARVSMEMDLLAVDSMTTDSKVSAQNISHNVFSFEPGVNFVVKSKNNGKSFFECKLSGTYYHMFSHPLPFQSADSSSINAVVRVRVINDTWVPITFKMDEHGHVYGSLGIKMNFNALAGILRQGK